MQHLKSLTKYVNILKYSSRHKNSSVPNNIVNRYVCQWQQTTFKLYKEHTNSRNISTAKTNVNDEPYKTKLETKNSEKINNKSNRVLHLYCDGAHVGNGQKNLKQIGGIGVYVPDDISMSISRPISSERLSPIVAEIEATIHALNLALEIISEKPIYDSVVISIDSLVLFKSIEKYSNNPVFTSNEELSYRDKFDKIVNLSKKFKKVNLKWNYVKGHSNIYGNEMADLLALKAVMAQKPNIDDVETATENENAYRRLNVYCNGSCIMNEEKKCETQVAGIGVYIPLRKSWNVSRTFSTDGLTPDLAEIEAAINALNIALKITVMTPSYETVIINTSSKFLVKAMKLSVSEWKFYENYDFVHRYKFAELLNLLKLFQNVKLEWILIKDRSNRVNVQAKRLAMKAITENLK